MVRCCNSTCINHRPNQPNNCSGGYFKCYKREQLAKERKYKRLLNWNSVNPDKVKQYSRSNYLVDVELKKRGVI